MTLSHRRWRSLGGCLRALRVGNRGSQPVPAAARQLGVTGPLVALLVLAPNPGAAAADTGAFDRRVLALARAVEAEPANQALATAFAHQLDRARAAPSRLQQELRDRLEALELEPLRVPGLFWQQHPQTGADLRAAERWLGRPIAMIETDEVGTVEANATQIADALRARFPGRERALLISASKGSADVRLALEHEPALGEYVAVWIDLVGVLEGTPLTDPRHAALAAEAGLPAETAHSMSSAVRSAAADPARFPSATRALHVAAFPSAADVSPAARPSFAWLQRLGPNDGYVLLEPIRRAPGRVLVLRGADHYLRGVDDLRERFLALLAVALDELSDT